MLEILGYTASFFTISATLPQLIKTIKTKSAGDVSSIMFAFMITGTLLWALYGYLNGSGSIVFANLTAAAVVFVNLIYKLKYNK